MIDELFAEAICRKQVIHSGDKDILGRESSVQGVRVLKKICRKKRHSVCGRIEKKVSPSGGVIDQLSPEKKSFANYARIMHRLQT